MPIINVPGVGQVNFPDSMSEKEIVEAIERDILKRKPEAKEATLKEKIADIPKALGRGAVGLLETAGIGASAALPEEYEKKARAGIESLAAPAREFLAPETPEVAETVSSKLATGLGSTLPFFLSAPLGLAGRVIAGGMGVSAGAGEARRGAEMAGATPEERRVATALGAPTGLLDIIAPNIGPLKSMLTTALARGGVEGATEAAQNVAQNLIARGVYDPKRDVLEGTAEEGAYGAGVGALASLILDMTLGRRAYQARQAPPSERPGAPETPEVLTVNAPRVPSGFTAEEAAGLRVEAEEMERARLSGIEEAARERMGEAQELARGLPGFAGTPGANVEMMEAMRQRQAQQAAMEQAQQAQAQKEAERIRLAQIKQIEESTFSSDPVADRLAKDRMLANLQPPTPAAPVAPTAVPEAPAMAGFAAPSQINAQMLEAARARQQQEQQAADKQRRDEIKRIESTTFSADPVQNEMAKRRALEAIGVAPQEPAVAEEPTYEQLQQRIAEAEAQDRKIRPLAERKAISRTRMAPEELEAMGIVPEERVKREAPKYKATEHPENIGFVGLDASNEPIVDLVTAGAKPFPTKKAAELGKRQRADMKIVKVPNGWVLSPKTEAEFAREGKTTVSEFQPGKPKGTPTAAHEFIVARGGLRKDQQANTSFPDENPRVGNRSLFSPTGGMTLSDAAELLREAGYIAEETETAAEAAITSSVRGNRIYTPEGYERAGEMQLESERTEEQRRQEREALFIPDADVFDYFYSDDFYRQPMDEVRRVAENRGVDFEGIAERLANEFPNATQEQYENAVRDAVGNEIRIRALPISEKLMAQEGQGNNATPEGEKIQKELAGKDINQVAQWTINNAPNNFQKLLAQKAKAMIDALQRRGVKMNFEIQGGNRRSPYLYRARGITSFIWDPQKGTQVDLLLNGEPVIKNQNGYASGMDYETVLHELLHVATRTSTKFLPTENQIRKDLVQLFNAVVSKYNADVKAGTLPPVLMKFYKNVNNVLESPDELITWGMTDRDFQNYLATINVGPKQTAFSKLVELIRELVGLAKPFETALEKLVRTTESILVMDLDVVNQSMYAQGYSFGPAPKPTTQMKQQRLFAARRVVRDDLSVRKDGFYFDAKASPLYQTRTAEEVGDFSQQEADKIVALEGRAKKIQDERRWVGKLKDGAWVGTRLDLAVFRVAKKAGLPPVLAVHEGSESKHTKGGFSKGELLRLVPHITLRNVRFNVMQGERERIAEGGEKGRMASADGQYMDVPPNFDGIEVSFNPTREHLFRDALGRAIKYADEVTVLKNRMYARGNIEYYGAEDVPPVPTQPSDSWIMESGQDARKLEQRPAIIDDAGKVSKDQQKNLFDGQDVIQDRLFSRETGFFIDARQSPLYQKRTEADVPIITQELADRALATHAKGARVEGKGIQLQPGDYIGARLDLPIRASSRDIMAGGVPLQAIHMGNASNYAREDGGFYNGRIAKYLPTVTMKNVKFRVNQAEREEIAAGRKKAPMGSADGQFVRSDNPNFDGIELRFNPKREHLFVDAMGRSVKYADEVTVMGDRMYARGHIEYFGNEDFIKPVGVSPTQARVMSVEEAVRQAGPAVERAVTEAARTGRPLPPPIQENLFAQQGLPPFDQAEVAGRKKITPVAAEEQIAIGSEEKYPTTEEKIILYLSNYPNATRKDMVVFDDAIFYKQPDGRYTDDPLGRPDRTDMEFDNELHVRKTIKQYYSSPFASFSLPPGRFAQLKSKAKMAANVPVISDILAAKEAPLQRTQQGQDAMDILAGMGREVKKPEDGYLKRVSGAWDNVRDNPKLVKEQSLGTFRRWADQFQTWAFSSDAALNNQIRREIMESNRGQEEKVGMLLNVSLSQTVNSDAIANLFLMKGNVRWDKELYKWVGEDDINNIGTLSAQLDEIASKHGLNKEEIELIAHTAFEAKRTRSLIRENQEIEAKAEAIRAEAARVRAKSPVAASELSDKASNLLQKRKVIHMTEDQIKAGMTQFELFPELKNLVDTWNGIRENGIRVLTETGLYSREEAENLLANADYVPFFREDQIEEGKGPKEFLRSLTVQADKRMKGSMKPVNDIFDNQVRWAQYAINRGVRNRSALALVDTAVEVGLAQQVKGPKDGDNVVRVWRNGKEEYYSMADPMFVTAFRGLESVAIPTVKFFSKFADILRQSVVLYPLFGVAQVPQDSFAAMFTSGLKPQYALRIPVLAVKEFVQTLRGKSTTHDILKNVGAAGVRDFTASVIRMDAEVLSGLKKDKSLWDRVKRLLGNVSMAADNAVRQAVFEAAEAQGLSRKEAIEKAFEIFNVRRRGSSQMLGLAGQVIPFFNAYLAAQNVAYRTLTGAGTSPTQREAAFKTLAATTGSVMALSILYAMMNADDEGYEKKATPTRDRLLIIPGTNGIGVPLRADAFILPKVLAEHVYHMLTENGMTDPGKFRESMKSLLANSIFSPTPVPQAVKPLAEAIMNYDFFQQKPLVGVFQQQKELGRQFEDSTSELSKLFGKTGYVSPIVSDHVIRGMFGSFGGLVLYMTNPILAAMSGTTRPDMSIQDAIATIPNASAFVSKEYELGLRKDFYALKEVTDRAASTLSDLKNRSPQEIGAYLEDPKIQQRIALSPTVNRIANQLTQIRKQINMITNIEDPSMSSAKKEEQIRQLRETELRLLKGIDLRRLREMAEV